MTAALATLVVVALAPLLLTPLKQALDRLRGHPPGVGVSPWGLRPDRLAGLAPQVGYGPHMFPLAYATDGEASAPCGKALPDAQMQPRTAEAAIPAPSETERSPLNRSDAMWIQEKLHDLAYFSGERDGVWDVASRNALFDFKIMNGLSADDRWDKETKQRLSSGQGIRADNTFMGCWASDIGQCRQGRDHGALIVITARAAETGSAKCDFQSVTRQVASRWRAIARCSDGRHSWNSNLQLKLTAPNLTWDRILEPAKETKHYGKHTDIEYTGYANDLVISTEQGSGRYVRCVEP